MKAMNFQDDIHSIPIEGFKNNYVLVYDLTIVHDAPENCHYPELAAESLRLELNFFYPPEQVTELIVLGERMSSVAPDKFGVVGKKYLQRIKFLSSNSSTVSHYSSICTVVLLPVIMFQFLTLTFLHFKYATQQYAG